MHRTCTGWKSPSNLTSQVHLRPPPRTKRPTRPHRKRYACLALGNLAVATVNHEEILDANGLEGLSSALDCDDQETVFNACYALNKLAMSEENHEVRWERYRIGEGCERACADEA